MKPSDNELHCVSVSLIQRVCEGLLIRTKPDVDRAPANAPSTEYPRLNGPLECIDLGPNLLKTGARPWGRPHLQLIGIRHQPTKRPFVCSEPISCEESDDTNGRHVLEAKLHPCFGMRFPVVTDHGSISSQLVLLESDVALLRLLGHLQVCPICED